MTASYRGSQHLSGANEVGKAAAKVALAKEAGFDVSKADWLKYQAKQTLELSDEELEAVAGGGGGIVCHSQGVEEVALLILMF